jgi:hypothetical protein
MVYLRDRRLDCRFLAEGRAFVLPARHRRQGGDDIDAVRPPWFDRLTQDEVNLLMA